MSGMGLLRGVVRQSVVWMVLSILLNLVWEVAHMPLYTLGPGTGMCTLTYAVMRCTVWRCDYRFRKL